MTIRRMIKSDVDEVARIVAETGLWQRYGLDFEKARSRFFKGLENGAEIFVAELNGEIAGFLWFVQNGAFDRSGYVELIGVKKKFRNRGIGRRLMEFAETRNVDSIFLLVSDFNTEAQKFYRGLGYIKVGEIKDYVVQGITEFIFYKKVR